MELIAKVEVRNERHVYADGGNYVVAHIDSKGMEHRTSIPAAAVNHLHDLCRGQTVTMAEVGERVAAFAKQYRLPYHYGYKLDHYALEMLVIMVAEGRAEHWKEGRGFFFSVINTP